MEILKNDKDVPTLISNIEVHYLLSNRIKERQAEEQPNIMNGNDIEIDMNNDTQHKQPVQQRKFRHRNFVEEKVVEYIQSSPCGNIDLSTSKNLPKFVSILKRKPRSIQDNSFLVKEEEAPNGDKGHMENSAVQSQEGQQQPIDHSNESEEEGFGLTDGESVQILNLIPRESVEMHLIIEDLTERLPESRQRDLLRVISDYCYEESDPNALEETNNTTEGENEEKHYDWNEEMNEYEDTVNSWHDSKII